MDFLGYFGTGLVVVAYLPQIVHLIKERCAAGLSVLAYVLWATSSVLLLAYAVLQSYPVFIALNGWSTLATGTILTYSIRLRGAT